MEEELQQEEDGPLRKVMFLVNDAEPQSEGHTDDILCELTEEFSNDKICDPKINRNLAKAINEVWGRKLTPEKLKIRLNKHLSQSNQELLQQRRDGITKNLSREYKTLEHNVPPGSKLLFGDNLSNRIKLLQASNKACQVNVTPNNSKYYQIYPNSKNFKDFSRRISTKTPFKGKPRQVQGNKLKFQRRN